MNGLVFISTLLLIFSGSRTLATSPVFLTVDELSKRVREKNQNVTGADHWVEAAQARTDHLARSFLPVLRLEGGGEAFQTGPYSAQTQPYGAAEVSINFFRGGKDALEENARTAEVSASSGVAKQTLAEELIQARKLYWEIVFSREVIKTLEAAVEQNEKLLELANRRISRGLSTANDRLEFEIHKSELKEEIESLSHGLLLLQIRLSAALGMTPDARYLTDEKIPHIHDETLLSAAFDPFGHPEVMLSKANEEIARAQKGQANRWWLPTVDGYAGYYLYTLRDRDYFAQTLRNDQVVGVKLTFELFDGLQSVAKKKGLSLQSAGFEAQTAQRLRSVTAQVEVAKEDLKHDHELIHNSEERIEQGKKYLDQTLGEYGRGVKGSNDALGAAQRYVAFQRQYAERRKNYQVTKSGLLALLGQ